MWHVPSLRLPAHWRRPMLGLYILSLTWQLLLFYIILFVFCEISFSTSANVRQCKRKSSFLLIYLVSPFVYFFFNLHRCRFQKCNIFTANWKIYWITWVFITNRNLHIYDKLLICLSFCRKKKYSGVIEENLGTEKR